MNDEAIGFVQSYLVSDDGWRLDGSDPGIRGIDQFLCNAEQLNQGLGSAMVTQFSDWLLNDPQVTRVMTDPSPDNTRAIRCYERAGFIATEEVDTPDGRALLMIKIGLKHR